MSRKPPVMERVVAGVTMFIAFLVMASIFVPGASDAGPGSGHHDGPDAAPAPGPGTGSVDPHQGLRTLALDHRLYRVVIYATSLGPRYSVYDRRNDEELAVLMSADEVAEHFPELPIPEMDFDGTVQLMLAEPR